MLYRGNVYQYGISCIFLQQVPICFITKILRRMGSHGCLQSGLGKPRREVLRIKCRGAKDTVLFRNPLDPDGSLYTFINAKKLDFVII